MKKYDYRAAICEDIREYIREQEITVTSENRHDVEQCLNDELFVNDSVTGNASGSYTFNIWKAEENLCYNMDLLCEAIEEFGGLPQDYKRCLESAETADVTIRCYLLGGCISTVLDELEEDVEEDYNEEV